MFNNIYSPNLSISYHQFKPRIIEESVMHDLINIFNTKHQNSDYLRLIRNIKNNAHKQDFNNIKKIAEDILNNGNNLIIVGMGGAILNPRAVLSYRMYVAHNEKVNVYFIDHLDIYEIENLYKTIDLIQTSFLFISNSGKTIEVQVICEYFIKTLKELRFNNIGRVFYFITNTHSPLRNIAKEISANVIDYQSELGGRFATFTNITFLPACVCGMNIEEFYEGSLVVLDKMQNQGQEILSNAMWLLDIIKNTAIHLNITYSNNLFELLDWYTNIIEETFFMCNKSKALICRLPLEHHTKFHSYIASDSNCYFSIFNIEDCLKKDNNICNTLNICSKFSLLSIESSSNPWRSFDIKENNLKSLGILMMHLIMEMALTSMVMKIDPLAKSAIDNMKEKLYRIWKYDSTRNRNKL